MVKRIRFTKTAVATLPTPAPGTRETYYDTKVPKLCVRITSTGARSFYVYKRVKGRAAVEWINLGTFPDTSIEQAQREAEKVLGDFAAGINPAEQLRTARQALTLGEGFENYWSGHVIPRKLKTADAMRQLFERCLGAMPDAEKKRHGRRREKHPRGVNWQNRAMVDITHADANKLHTGIGTDSPVLANRVCELGSAVWNHQGITPNPFSGIEPFYEEKRDVFIEPEHLPRVAAALEEDSSDWFRDWVWLDLMTGARKSNLLALPFAQLRLDGPKPTWTIPGVEPKNKKLKRGQTTKNSRPHEIPLVSVAVEILRARREAYPDSPLVFPAESASGHRASPKKRWAALLDRIELRELEKRIRAKGGAFKWANDGSESLARAVTRAREVAAGLKVDTSGARLDLRIHDLRRSLGSWQAIGGASLPIIGKSLGHRNASSTAIYARLHDDPVRRSVESATSAMLVAAGVKQPAKVKTMRRLRAVK